MFVPMNRNKYTCFLLLVLLLESFPNQLHAQFSALYPSYNNRRHSLGKTTYFIDPNKGNDQNSGTSVKHPWKSFRKANQLIFAAGDKLMVIAPGKLDQSLVMIAQGNQASPVSISFAPGRYDFYPDSAFKTRFNISNTNDTPLALKAIALYFVDSRYTKLSARGAQFVLRGKMIETCVDRCQNISMEGMSFDYKRPTVSELQVMAVTQNYADLKVHQDSKYTIQDSVLTWEGEGWRYKTGWYWQEFNPETGNVSRVDLNTGNVKFVQHDSVLKAYFIRNPGFKKGMIYQTRDVTRDCAGIFLQRSKNITLKNMHIYFMHGMGVVSQYCDNISIDSLSVKPAPNSGRTCAAWADILHFSGCRGTIKINHSYLSAANDDAINVHGTFLKIVEKPSPNQIIVRFMHDQTYGFDAFKAGDSIDFIHPASLLPFGNNLITAQKKIDDKTILLTFQKPVTDVTTPGDVVENISWTPKLLIQNTIITRIPTRGILVTTRRKAIIEKCTFKNVNSSSILVEDDAGSWYESGMVRDLTIRKNTFISSGEPVISIHPENKNDQGAVHKNIAIYNNDFLLTAASLLSAESTSNISFFNNVIHSNASIDKLVIWKNCTNVKLYGNSILKK
jgi:hypothetical protein